jgi:hypothetical protein
MVTALGTEHDDAIVKPYDPDTGEPITSASHVSPSTTPAADPTVATEPATAASQEPLPG